MANIWVFSDWHWRHENIYGFTYTDTLGVERRVRERFKDASEGDAFIEQRWRELIKPPDHVWGLGDWTVFRGKHMVHEFTALMKSLPGHKRTLLGNHDQYDIKTYIEAGFQKIKASHVLDNVLLTHYPVHPGSLSHRLIANVHGHTHQNPNIKTITYEGKPKVYLNVCVERTSYEPLPWEEVKKRIKELS